jgi:hypothetical protein
VHVHRQADDDAPTSETGRDFQHSLRPLRIPAPQAGHASGSKAEAVADGNADAFSADIQGQQWKRERA